MCTARLFWPILLVFALPHATLGWDNKGHEVVAYIAYEHLDPSVRARVDSLLKQNPCYAQWTQAVNTLPQPERPVAIFMLAATWPDLIKDKSYSCPRDYDFVSDGWQDVQSVDLASAEPEATQNIGYMDTNEHRYWHYVDIPFSTDFTPTKPPLHPNALDMISVLTTALASDEPEYLESFDLVWVEHLVGDVHQPLHDTSRFTVNHPDGDAGGNRVSVKDTTCGKTNLHAYWDSILSCPPDSGDLVAALSLGSKLNKRQEPFGADITDPRRWVEEGFRLAIDRVYRPPVSSDEPNSPVGILNKQYHDAAEDIAQSQVLLAGYRLAGLLNKALQATGAGKVSRRTALGMTFCVDPIFLGEIEEEARKIHREIEAQHEAGKFVAYLSTPFTPRGGGFTPANKEISHFVKQRLEAHFGSALWVLDPIDWTIPQRGTKKAGGAEYMLMWANVLGGKDGLGADFNMFVMTGPSDIHAFFRKTQPSIDGDVFGALDKWVNERAAWDTEFRETVAENSLRRRRFIAYYGVKASVSFSLGSHDEWNVFVGINEKRRSSLGTAEQIPVYYDGRSLSPAEMETRISAGNEGQCH